MLDKTSLNVIPPVQARQCGTCTACCDVLAVQELGKPFYARCHHLQEGSGCTIYEQRPQSCACFQCAWYAGILGDSTDRRPDRCGVMFDLNPVDQPPVIKIWETIPGALSDGPRIQFMLRKMLEHKKIKGTRFGKFVAVLYPYGSRVGINFSLSAEYGGPEAARPEGVLIRPIAGAAGIGVFTGVIEKLKMPEK